MKKLLLLALLVSGGAWANSAYKATSECQFDYDDFNFCSKSNIAKYKKALISEKANFNTKYILINIGSSNKTRFVAIDTKNGLVFPMSDTIVNFKDSKGSLTNTPALINYSINNQKLCIKGSIEAYRDSYDNVISCYSIENDEYSKYGKSFNRLGTPQEIN